MWWYLLTQWKDLPHIVFSNLPDNKTQLFHTSPSWKENHVVKLLFIKHSSGTGFGPRRIWRVFIALRDPWISNDLNPQGGWQRSICNTDVLVCCLQWRISHSGWTWLHHLLICQLTYCWGLAVWYVLSTLEIPYPYLWMVPFPNLLTSTNHTRKAWFSCFVQQTVFFLPHRFDLWSIDYVLLIGCPVLYSSSAARSSLIFDWHGRLLSSGIQLLPSSHSSLLSCKLIELSLKCLIVSL